VCVCVLYAMPLYWHVYIQSFGKMSCRGCSLKLFEFAAMVDDKQKLREFLVRHHVSAGVCLCEQCRHMSHWSAQEVVLLHPAGN